MRSLLAAALCIFSMSSFAADPKLVGELRAKCDKEKASLFRDNNGTPSCDRLEKALREGSTKNDVTTYKWNGMAGKYCYYNEAGEITMCL